MDDLSGKNVLITGSTSGIGLEAAVQVASLGANVWMVGRDPAKTAAKVDEVKARARTSTVESLLCDFAIQDDIRALAREVLAKCSRLDVLVNNAGSVFPARILTKDGIESTFATNHMSYYLLTRLLLDLLVKSAPARIVNVASVAHRRATMDLDDLGFARGYRLMRAYGRSKLGNVLFTRELAHRLATRGVTVNALHPGTVATGIWSHGHPKYARFTVPLFNMIARLTMLTPAQGAETITYLVASPEVEGKTGLYYEKNRSVAPSALAQDDTLARRLWEESARLVKLSP